MQTLMGSVEDDFLFGTSGRDFIVDDDGNDVIAGGGGNDIFVNGAGNDKLLGQGGDDYFMVYDLFALDTRRLVINGGSGEDTFNLRTQQNWDVEVKGNKTILTPTWYDDGVIVLRNVEHITYDGELY